ncbi:hypothetical protein [Streptomyces sp. NPDC017993]|uniref:hypothetical protein n=1 Tax=Streptomyces sp. NPDC017993 TaxID=3365027 RepID=UPI0037B3B3EC
MSAHQSSPTSEGRGGTPFAAARRADHEAPEQSPTMHELLAACAAASAVSTPPDAPSETALNRRADEPGEAETDGEAGAASTSGRDAA